MAFSRDFDLVDVQIAYCKTYGMSHLETAQAVSTPEHPTGVSDKTIGHRVQTKKPQIDEMVRWMAAIKREKTLEVREISRKTIKAEMEKELGNAWASIVAAVKDGDTESAWRLIEHQIGKPSQVHKHEGEIDVHHMVWQPERALVQQEHDILDSQKLLEAIPADVLEAEVVEPL